MWVDGSLERRLDKFTSSYGGGQQSARWRRWRRRQKLVFPDGSIARFLHASAVSTCLWWRSGVIQPVVVVVDDESLAGRRRRRIDIIQRFSVVLSRFVGITIVTAAAVLLSSPLTMPIPHHTTLLGVPCLFMFYYLLHVFVCSMILDVPLRLSYFSSVYFLSIYFFMFSFYVSTCVWRWWRGDTVYQP